MNALAEPSVIQALYRASQAGVPIDLVVRGFTTLRPGVPGVSENIKIHSVLGRFLEHARTWAFGPDLDEVWCSSADWRTRNLHRRVEVAFPIRDPEMRRRVVHECLLLPLSARFVRWEVDPDGTAKRHPAKAGRSLQDFLIKTRNGYATARPQADLDHTL